MVLTLEIPYPVRWLSPNNRTHMSRRAHFAYKSTVAKQRKACREIAGQMNARFPEGAELFVYATYFHRDRRSFSDADNLIARLKSSIDGIADGLEFNDKQVKRVEVDERTDKNRQRVVMILSTEPRDEA